MGEETKRYRYRYRGPAGFIGGVGYITTGELLPDGTALVTVARLLAYKQVEEEIVEPLFDQAAGGTAKRVSPRTKGNPDAQGE